MIILFAISSAIYKEGMEHIVPLRRVKEGFLVNKIKEYFVTRSNPEVFLKNDLIEFVNNSLGREYSEEEIFSSLRELMFKEEIPEYFEIVNKDTASPTGVLKQRDAVHRDGDWHLAVSILIFDKDGNLLIQKRAPHIAEPGRWEVSASGHLAPGETPQMAIVRELEEEIGLRVKIEDLIPIGELNQFIKIGRRDVRESHFEGGAYIHHSDDPPNNAERLSLFMYVVSDEEKAKLLRKFQEGKHEDVSEIKFENINNLLESFRQSPPDYSSAFAVYFSNDYVIHSQAQNRHGITSIEKTGIEISSEAGRGKFNREKKDTPLTYYGISLVTDIEPSAKQELGGILEELQNDENVGPLIDFVSQESLHMTIADLITSNKLYKNPESPIAKEDQNGLLKDVIRPAFQEFIEGYSAGGEGIRVKVDGIGMFPNGVLFFSVHVEREGFNVLKSLRGKIKPRLGQAFPNRHEPFYDDYITHITIGYLREEVRYSTHPEFFKKLIEVNRRLKDNPIEFVITEGKVVIFEDMNSFNKQGETVLDEIKF